jgi:hypothetical protein
VPHIVDKFSGYWFLISGVPGRDVIASESSYIFPLCGTFDVGWKVVGGSTSNGGESGFTWKEYRDASHGDRGYKCSGTRCNILPVEEPCIMSRPCWVSRCLM